MLVTVFALMRLRYDARLGLVHRIVRVAVPVRGPVIVRVMPFVVVLMVVALGERG